MEESNIIYFKHVLNVLRTLLVIGFRNKNSRSLMLHLVFLTILLSFNRQYSTDYKLETYLKIARLYLEDDDAVQAEAYINRASLLQAETKNEELQIHYKVSYFLLINCHSKIIFSLWDNKLWAVDVCACVLLFF